MAIVDTPLHAQSRIPHRPAYIVANHAAFLALAAFPDAAGTTAFTENDLYKLVQEEDTGDVYQLVSITPSATWELWTPPMDNGIVKVDNGGTGSNLSGTGGTDQVLQQSSVGANITVAQLNHSQLGGVTADQHHNRQHALDSTTDHTGITGTEDNLMSLDANGLPQDSGVTATEAAGITIDTNIDDYITLTGQDLAAKSDVAAAQVLASPEASVGVVIPRSLTVPYMPADYNVSLPDALFHALYDGPAPIATDQTGILAGQRGQEPTASGGVYFGRGLWHKAVVIAQSGTNQIPDSRFASAANWTYFQSGINGSFTVTSDHVLWGTTGGRILASNATTSQIRPPSDITVSNGASITFQVWMWRDTDVDATIRLNNQTDGGTVAGPMSPTVVGEWEFLWVTWTNSLGANKSIRPIINNAEGDNAGIVFVDGAQVTLTSFPLPFIGHGMPGHTSSGTFDNSTVSRDDAVLSYSNPLNQAAGTIAFWWTPTADNTGPFRTLWDEGTLSGYFDTVDDFLKFTDGTSTIGAAISFGEYERQHVAFTWATSSLAVYRNGALLSSTASYAAPTLGANLFIGSDASSTTQCDGAIEDLFILDYAASATQIKAIYDSGVPVIVGDAQPLRRVNGQTGTTYTITAGDLARLVSITNGSAITVTLPSNGAGGIFDGFECEVYQGGAGQITFSTSATLRNQSSHTKTAGQYAVVKLRFLASSNEWVLSGNTGA